MIFDDGSEAPPGWYAAIHGEKVDVELWLRSFGATDEPAVRRQNHGLCYITSSSFLSAPNKAAAYTGAKDLIARLNLKMARSCAALPLEMAWLLEVHRPGQVTQHHSGVMLVGPSQHRQAPPAIPERIAKQMSRIDLVPHLLLSFEAVVDWPAVFRTLELAERVAGGARKLACRLNSDRQLYENLRWTANFHRHAIATAPPVLSSWAAMPRLLRRIVREALSALPDRSPFPEGE